MSAMSVLLNSGTLKPLYVVRRGAYMSVSPLQHSAHADETNARIQSNPSPVLSDPQLNILYGGQ